MDLEKITAAFLQKLYYESDEDPPEEEPEDQVDINSKNRILI